MLSCFIIDDEQAAIDILKNFISKVPFLKLVGESINPIEALSGLGSQKVDLVFLDIHMPQLSGIELIKIINGRSKVILTSANSEFALAGYDFEVLDYLLKPIPFERFLKAAQKALNSLSITDPSWMPSIEEDDDYVFVKTENKGKMVKVNFNDISYVEGLKNYISIYLKEERVITLANIKDLEERLPKKQFLRVHKSYIVSMNKIKAVDGNQILLKDIKAYVPLGNTYRTSFFEALNKKVMGSKR